MSAQLPGHAQTVITGGGIVGCSVAYHLTKLGRKNVVLWGLPESIGKLAGLSELIVSSNELTTLPDYIGRLTNLQAFDLSSNRLTALPKSMGKMPGLRHVDLDDNPIDSALQHAYDEGLDVLWT